MPLPVKELTNNSRNKLAQNTLALGAALNMMGVSFSTTRRCFDRAIRTEGRRRGAENVDVARAGYDHASDNFQPLDEPLPMTENPRPC